MKLLLLLLRFECDQVERDDKLVIINSHLLVEKYEIESTAALGELIMSNFDIDYKRLVPTTYRI